MRLEVLLLAFIVATSGCIHAGEPVEPEPDTADNRESPTSDTSDSTSQSNTVYLTSSGFQPSELTIQQGETVTWVNNASQPMWIASDRHPTHTNYAGSSISEHCSNGESTGPVFDQCSAGERYSFTFEQTGEWSYHNHENAGQTGTVIVE